MVGWSRRVLLLSLHSLSILFFFFFWKLFIYSPVLLHNTECTERSVRQQEMQVSALPNVLQPGLGLVVRENTLIQVHPWYWGSVGLKVLGLQWSRLGLWRLTTQHGSDTQGHRGLTSDRGTGMHGALRKVKCSRGAGAYLGVSPESCAQMDVIQEGMSQVDSLRDCLFYCSSLYTTGHDLCVLQGRLRKGILWKVTETYY